MVITKELNQKIIIAATVASFCLIIGSIYLHVQQKTHLGRMNIGDLRAQPTDGVENLPDNDDDLQPTASKAIPNQPEIVDGHIYGDYVYVSSKEYVNDSAEDDANVESSKEALGDTKSTESYIKDNAPYSSVEYDYPASEEFAMAKGAAAADKVGSSEDCLRCLCRTVNNCKPVKCALVDPCGIYGISKYYWMDGGKQTTVGNLNDYDEEDEEHIDYLRCVNDEQCATQTVQKYISRYQKDCNNDGVINCEDHITLHLLGPTGCSSKQMSPIHRMRMKSCLK